MIESVLTADQLAKWMLDAKRAGIALEVSAVGTQPELFGGTAVQMLNVKSLKGEIKMVSETVYEEARKIAREIKADA